MTIRPADDTKEIIVVEEIQFEQFMVDRDQRTYKWNLRMTMENI